jgi:hypothetical protein
MLQHIAADLLLLPLAAACALTLVVWLVVLL